MNNFRIPKKFRRMLVLSLLTVGLVFSAAPALAEPLGNPPQPENPPLSLTVTPFYQAPASLNHGGKLAVSSMSLDLGTYLGLSESLGVGLRAGYDYINYHFSGPVVVAGSKPWGEVHRLELGGNVNYDLTPEWSLMINPSVQFSREGDADWGNAIGYGGITTVSYDFSPRLTLGTGIAAFVTLDEVEAFPVFLVKWQITDRLQLTNPLRPGPTGPAGLEFCYAVEKDLDIAAGAAFRFNRFRLGSSGAVKEGIGESSALPVFGRLTWKTGKRWTLDLYAGAMVSGSVLVNDRNNNRISSDHYEPAPFAALSVTGSF